MHCPVCQKKALTLASGTIVCLHCGTVNGNRRAITVESTKTTGARITALTTRLNQLPLRTKQRLSAVLAISLVLLSLTAVTLASRQPTPVSTATTSSPKAAASTSKAKSTTGTPAPTAPSTPAPAAAPTPTKTTLQPKPAVAPTPSSYVVTTSLCQVDATQAPDQLSRAREIADACQASFPQIEARLTPSLYPALHHIVFDYNQYAAYASAGIVHVSIDWLRKSPFDPGVAPHELTHVIQNYGPIAPGWITEGIATYMSYKLGYSIGIAHCNSNERYTSGYGCGASLFNYIERVYRPTIIKEVHNSIKANTYSDSLFQSTTGKPLSTLYSECLNAECKGGAL